MTVHRFYYPHQLGSNHSVTIRDAGIIEQLRKVLRAKPGFIASFFDGMGSEYLAELQSYGKHEAVFLVGQNVDRDAELKQSIALYQAIPNRMPKFEEVLKHCTELGVREFIPLVTQRVQTPFLRKEDRLRKIIQESCEQCEGNIMPMLHPCQSFSELLTSPPHGRNILLFARGDNHFDRQRYSDDLNLNIFIGPEGGFTHEEVDAALAAGFDVVTLGNRILRTETAALVMVSQFI